MSLEVVGSHFSILYAASAHFGRNCTYAIYLDWVSNTSMALGMNLSE
jgi:hypothetical protein